jgi:site-specific DNA-methyltransferase (adenine-specific)
MPLKGIEPPPGRAWAPPTRNKFPASAQALLPDNYEALDQLAKCEVLDDAGLLYWPKGKIGRPRWKKYLSAMPGVVAGDLVLDTPPVKGKEDTGYPTQKPIALLERIIKASSDKADIVLDPFCGCATTCIAAEKLGRQWVGIDISPRAVELVRYRLERELGLDEREGILGQVIHRTDIPQPSERLPNYRTHKHTLYGQQEGLCNGCRTHFPFRNMTVDHIVAQSQGGSDHLENLQLLCNFCNSVKGTNSQAHLITRLQEMGI